MKENMFLKIFRQFDKFLLTFEKKSAILYGVGDFLQIHR